MLKIKPKLKPKGKKNSGLQLVRVERTGDIKHLSEFVDWQPLNYVIPESYLEYVESAKSDIQSLVEGAMPDRYNARFYEKTVDEKVREAVADLEEEHINHGLDIERAKNSQKARLKDMQKKLSRKEEKLSKTQKEYDAVLTRKNEVLK